MQTFLANHISNIVLVILLLIYVICLNGVFSKRHSLMKIRYIFAFFLIVSTIGLLIGTIWNELSLYWFNQASFNIESNFEMIIKVIYDLISTSVIFFMLFLIKNIIMFLKTNTLTVIRKIAINTNIIAILIIIRTVIIPLCIKIIRVLELFGLNNQTSSSNDVFLYALPYLGLPEVAIIVVTIFINILGLNYWNRGDDDVMAE